MKNLLSESYSSVIENLFFPLYQFLEINYQYVFFGSLFSLTYMKECITDMDNLTFALWFVLSTSYILLMTHAVPPKQCLL